MNKQVLCLNVKFVQLVDNTDSYKIRLRVRILKGKDGKMEFLIVSGLSGAGKSVTIYALEDIGFYCVDNIPSKLVVTFYDLCERAKEDFSRVAVVTDIRGGALSDKFFEFLETFKERKVSYKILFLDAGDIVLVHRYKETRRRHPLSEAASGSLEQAVKMEREMLRPMREAADYIIDTSYLAPSQLKQRLSNLFLGNVSDALTIQIMSFGFKNGIPTEADMMFDVRCLPNPFYVPELKKLTGLDEPVKEYVMKWDETQGFITRFLDLIDYMIPLFCNEGKSQLVIAIGCTGGQHRSVTIVELLYKHLIAQNKRASVNHRDIKR